VSGVIESRADGGATVTAWFDQGIISRRDTTDQEPLVANSGDVVPPSVAAEIAEVGGRQPPTRGG
jgi:hypothetical protein